MKKPASPDENFSDDAVLHQNKISKPLKEDALPESTSSDVLSAGNEHRNDPFTKIRESKLPLVVVKCLSKKVLEHYGGILHSETRALRHKDVQIISIEDSSSDEDDDLNSSDDDNNVTVINDDAIVVIDDKPQDMQKSKLPVVLLKPLGKKDMEHWKTMPRLIKEERITRRENEDEETFFHRLRESKYPIVALRCMFSEAPPIENNFIKSYECSFCKRFENKYSYNAVTHALTHAEFKIFQCLDCDYGANREDRMLMHQKTHGANAKKYQMKRDQKEASEFVFKKFIVTYYRCCKCSFSTNDESVLEEHRLTHSIKKLSNLHSNGNISDIKRSQCKLDFKNSFTPGSKDPTSPLKLKIEVDTVDEQSDSTMFVSIYRCFVCKYETEKMECAKKHSLSHIDFKQFRCKKCRFGANQKQRMKRHFLRDHGEENTNPDWIITEDIDIAMESNCSRLMSRILRCSVCSYETEDAVAAGKHGVAHADIELGVYVCWECDYKADCKLTLKTHLQEHAIKSSKKANRGRPKSNSAHGASSSTSHFKIKEKNDFEPNIGIEVKRFKCSECIYETYNMDYLRKHLEIIHDRQEEYADGESPSHAEARATKRLEPESQELDKTGVSETASSLKDEEEHHQNQNMIENKRKADSLFKCSECEFVTKDRLSLTKHSSVIHSHDTGTSSENDFETKSSTAWTNSDLTINCPDGRDAQVNNSKDQVGTTSDVFRCSECKFITKCKENLNKHFSTFHSEGKNTTKSVTLRAKRKFSVNSDASISDSINDRKVSRQGQNRKGNFRKSQSRKDSDLFKCLECEFVTKHKQNLPRHCSAIHSQDIEISSESAFETDISTALTERRTKASIRLRDKGDTQVNNSKDQEYGTSDVFKCSECKFFTKYKRNLKTHFASFHFKDENTPERYTPPAKRKDNVDSEGTSLTDNKEHHQSQNMKRSKRNSQRQENSGLFKCAKRTYNVDSEGTILTDNKEHHQSQNMKRSKRNSQRQENSGLFKCAKCIFVTKHEQSYIRHFSDCFPLVTGTLSESDSETDSSTSWTKKQAKTYINNRDREKVEVSDSDDNEYNVSNLYSCSVCEFYTKHKQSLSKHISTFHCEENNTSSRRSSRIKPESNVDSLNEDKIQKDNPTFYNCSDCDFYSTVKRNLIRHLKVHSDSSTTSTGRKRQLNGSCVKMELDKSQDSEHLEKSKNFSCSQCSFIASTTQGLISHQKIHLRKPEIHEEQGENHSTIRHDGEQTRKNSLLSCSDCNFSTSTKEDLINHYKVHSKNRSNNLKNSCQERERENNADIFTSTKQNAKFRCTICSYETHTRPNLTRHMKNHSSVKSFKCIECDFVALEVTAFTRHMDAHLATKDEIETDYRGTCNLGSLTQEEESIVCKLVENVISECLSQNHDQNASECAKISYSVIQNSSENEEASNSFIQNLSENVETSDSSIQKSPENVETFDSAIQNAFDNVETSDSAIQSIHENVKISDSVCTIQTASENVETSETSCANQDEETSVESSDREREIIVDVARSEEFIQNEYNEAAAEDDENVYYKDGTYASTENIDHNGENEMFSDIIETAEDSEESEDVEKSAEEDDKKSDEEDDKKSDEEDDVISDEEEMDTEQDVEISAGEEMDAEPDESTFTPVENFVAVETVDDEQETENYFEEMETNDDEVENCYEEESMGEEVYQPEDEEINVYVGLPNVDFVSCDMTDDTYE